MTARTDDDLHFLRAFLAQLKEECYQFDVGEDDARGESMETDQPPTTSSDEERCARLADALGFDGNLFRNLFHRTLEQAASIRRQRVGILPRMIAELESRQGSIRRDLGLTSDHVQILQFLAQQRVLAKQSEIEIAVQRCRKTVGKRLRELRSYGLVDRPKGQRTGEAITEAGRQILRELGVNKARFHADSLAEARTSPGRRENAAGR